MGQLHHHHPHVHHQHGHRAGHRALWLGSGSGVVHRVGRRQFLTDIGRGAFAVAVLGGVAACSGDDDAAVSSSPTDSSGALDSSDVDVETAAPPTAPTSSGEDESQGTTLQWAQVGLGFVSAYVLVRGGEAAVVDTGTSGSADQIGEALATLGVNFDDVKHVVLTHSHGDHIGSLPDVLDRSPSVAVGRRLRRHARRAQHRCADRRHRRR